MASTRSVYRQVLSRSFASAFLQVSGAFVVRMSFAVSSRTWVVMHFLGVDYGRIAAGAVLPGQSADEVSRELAHGELREHPRHVVAEFVLEPGKLFANCLVEILCGYERSQRDGCYQVPLDRPD